MFKDEPPIATQGVSDPDPLSYAKPQPNPKQDVAQSSKEAGVAGNQDSEKSTPSLSITGLSAEVEIRAGGQTIEEICGPGTDISKITRKQSKTGKHGHENQKRTKRSQRIKAEARKSKTAVKSSQHGQQQ
ncbi:hypothetical protein Tco_1335496 [Tanacetum coccineum]